MSRQYPTLASFLSSAFYQGWEGDGGTAETRAEEFLRRTAPEVLRALAVELEGVLARGSGREELERFLLRECSCYYAPRSRDGPRAWLGRLARSIRRLLGDGPPGL